MPMAPAPVPVRRVCRGRLSRRSARRAYAVAAVAVAMACAFPTTGAASAGRAGATRAFGAPARAGTAQTPPPDDGASRGALGSRDPFAAFRRGDMGLNDLVALCKELRNSTEYRTDAELRENVEETCPSGSGLSMVQMNLLSLAGIVASLACILSGRMWYLSRLGVHPLERFVLQRQTEEALALLRGAQDARKKKDTGGAVWHAPSFSRRQLAETPIVRTRIGGDAASPRAKADDDGGNDDGDDDDAKRASLVHGHSASKSLPDTDVLVRTLCIASATDSADVVDAVLALDERVLALSIERATPPPPAAVVVVAKTQRMLRHTPSIPLNVACGTGSALALDRLLHRMQHDTTRNAARFLADAMLACARGTAPLVVLMGRIGSKVQLPEAPVAPRAQCLERLLEEKRAFEALESMRSAEREDVFRLREAGRSEAIAAAAAANERQQPCDDDGDDGDDEGDDETVLVVVDDDTGAEEESAAAAAAAAAAVEEAADMPGIASRHVRAGGLNGIASRYIRRTSEGADEEPNGMASRYVRRTQEQMEAEEAQP